MQAHGGDAQRAQPWPQTPSDPSLYPISPVKKAALTIEHLTNEIVTEVDDDSVHALKMRIAAISAHCRFSLRQMALLPSNDSTPTPTIDFYIMYVLSSTATGTILEPTKVDGPIHRILKEFHDDIYSNNPTKLIHDKATYYHQALDFCAPVSGRWSLPINAEKVPQKRASHINFTNKGSGSPSHTLLFPNCSDFEINNCIITNYGSDPTARERLDRLLLLEYRLLGTLWISIAVLFY